MKNTTNYEFEIMNSHRFVKIMISLLSSTDDLLDYFETAYTVEAEDYEKLTPIVRALDEYVIETIQKIPDNPSKVERDLLHDYTALCFCNWEHWKKSDDLFQDDSIAAKLFLDKLHLTINSPEAKALFDEVYDYSMGIYEIEEVAEGQVDGAKEAILFELEARKKLKKYRELAQKTKKEE